MNFLVTGFASNTEIQQMTDGANAAMTLFQPNSVNLTNAEASGLRTMSQGREGIVRLISKIATQNVNNLPRNEDPAQLSERLDYYASLSSLRQAFMPIFEMIDNTQNALGADIMQLSDRYAGYLQAARSSNSALDMAMGEVDDWNKRFGERPVEEDNNPEPPKQ